MGITAQVKQFEALSFILAGYSFAYETDFMLPELKSLMRSNPSLLAQLIDGFYRRNNSEKSDRYCQK